MSDINSIIITGHVTRDAELKTLATGTAVASFGVAVNGFKEGSVTFFNVQIWNKYAETMAGWITKGRGIVVEGRHESRDWIAQDGTKRTGWTLTASTIKLTTTPKAEGAPAAGPGKPAAAQDQDFDNGMAQDEANPFDN